jgi:hypothetical protein
VPSSTTRPEAVPLASCAVGALICLCIFREAG